MKSFVAALALALALPLGLAACGPTPKEIATAKSARYGGPSIKLLDAAAEVAAEDYKVGDIDQVAHRFTTQPQMYNSEGGRESPGADNYTQFRDRSVLVSFIVTVVPLATNDVEFVVTVTPHTLQMMSGTPQPRELREDDPNLPPWVHGRVDALAMKIYERLKPLAR